MKALAVDLRSSEKIVGVEILRGVAAARGGRMCGGSLQRQRRWRELI